jgi:hypothetical protein
MTAAYRIRQGVRALIAFARPIDQALAVEYLSPPLLALFNRMRRAEQLHSLNVLRSVLEQGQTPPDLAVAALLHDVGKIRYPLAVWHKTVAVLVRTFLPSLFRRLSEGDPRPFRRRAFVVYTRHPAWSGELIAQTGGSTDAVWLATHHADNAEKWRDHALYPLLKRLQMADDAN